MTESLLNAFQLVITGICAGIALFRSAGGGGKTWTLLGLFSGIFFMGDLYWQLFLVFYGMTPPYSFIPYLSWYSSYLFLLMLLIEIKGRVRRRPVTKIIVPVMVFTVSMSLLFMTHGDYIGNLICFVLMSMLIYHSLDGLMNYPVWKSFFAAVLFFCFAEYGTWTASCFDETMAGMNLYYLFDLLLSVSIIFITMAAGRTLGKEAGR